MADEQWTVVLKEDYSVPEAAGVSPMRESPIAKDTKTTAEEIKKSVPMWANIVKGVGMLVGITGGLAFVVGVFRRSKIFSTFMDTFLTTFSAFVDLILVPFIPLLTGVLESLVPIMFALSTVLTPILDSLVKALDPLLSLLKQLLPSTSTAEETRKKIEEGSLWNVLKESMRLSAPWNWGEAAKVLDDILFGAKIIGSTEWNRIIKMYPSGVLQLGTPFVPTTGMYMLHKGEAVVPAAQNRGNVSNNSRIMNVTNTFNISADASLLAKRISLTLDEELRNSALRIW